MSLLWERVQGIRDRSWAWFSARAHGKGAVRWLAILSFIEPITISFVVPETLLAAILFAGAQRWRYYAFIASIFSILGGIVGYFVGFFLFELIGEKLLAFYDLTSYVMEAQDFVAGGVFLSMLLISFTPLPDKVFVLIFGFLGVAFLPYILGYIIGRSARFFLTAYLIYRFGPAIITFINRYFNIAAFVAVLALLTFVAYKVFM